MCNMLYIQIKQNVSIYEPYLPGEVATSSFISDFMHVCIYIHVRVCFFHTWGYKSVCCVYTDVRVPTHTRTHFYVHIS